jgi:hypothetical protein
MNDQNDPTSSLIKTGGGPTEVEPTAKNASAIVRKQMLNTMMQISVSRAKKLDSKRRMKPADDARIAKHSEMAIRAAAELRLQEQFEKQNLAGNHEPQKPRVPSFAPGVPVQIQINSKDAKVPDVAVDGQKTGV